MQGEKIFCKLWCNKQYLTESLWKKEGTYYKAWLKNILKNLTSQSKSCKPREISKHSFTN